MSIENKSTAPQVSVLAEISARLAAITPEQFIAPPKEDDADGTIVCVASDDIKRLSTLREMLYKEMDEIAIQGRQLALAGLTDVISKGFAVVSAELLTPGGRAQEIQVKLIENNCLFDQKKCFVAIIDGIFWFDLRRQHPDLQDKPIVGLCSDWSIYWQEDIGERHGMSVDLQLPGLADLGRMFGGGQQKPN